MEAVARINIGGLVRTSRIQGDIVVGKDVLELVAGAMYADPLTVYREYIQNAADAVDEARKKGAKCEDSAHVMIHLDHVQRTVSVRDLGAGVQAADFVRRLSAVGASGKRGTTQRGFRGVGRLSGLGYCQELIFRSRAVGETKVSELRWDNRVLREKLRDASFKGSLSDLIREVATVATIPDGSSFPAHFFEVEMRKVVRIKNDVLMNEDEIRNYLAQVAPVPFAPGFKFGEVIRSKLDDHGIGEPITIELSDGRGPIYHRGADQVSVSKSIAVKFDGVEPLVIKNSAGETLAIGWMLKHEYLGSMPRSTNQGGIRLRMRDVQVGDAQILAPLYSEARFCSWPVGELHVVHPKILPNARRDEFEHSAAYGELQDELQRLAASVAQQIRRSSDERRRAKRLTLNFTYAETWVKIAQQRNLHETIRLAALERANDQGRQIEKESAKVAISAETEQGMIRLKGQLKRLSESLETKKKSGHPGVGKTKSALAAVSAILTSTPHAHKAVPMAERVLAAMEGRLEEAS